MSIVARDRSPFDFEVDFPSAADLVGNAGRPFRVEPTGANWVVRHDSLARDEYCDAFADALALAERLADEANEQVQIVHPRTLNGPWRWDR